MAKPPVAANIEPPWQNMQKVGEANFEFLFWDIYHSTLYSSSGEFSQGTYPVALHIEYLRNIDAKDLVERTEQEWRKLGFKEDDYASWIQSIGTMWPDIEKGDTLTLMLEEDGQSAFYFNSSPLGTIPDKAFGSSFLAIWLDEKCSYPTLRRQLLGMN